MCRIRNFILLLLYFLFLSLPVFGLSSEERAKVDSLEQNLIQLSQEVQQLRNLRESYKIQLQNLNDSITKTEILQKDYETQIQNLTESIESLNKIISDKETSLQELQAEISTLTQQSTELTMDLQAASKSLTNLNSEKNAYLIGFIISSVILTTFTIDAIIDGDIEIIEYIRNKLGG